MMRLTVVSTLVTLVAAFASAFVAFANLTRRPFVIAQARSLRVAESWIPILGALHVAAALGLLLGLAGVPYVGAAAAAGLVLYLVGAIVVHLRARDRSLGGAVAFLLLAAAALVAQLQTR